MKSTVAENKSLSQNFKLASLIMRTERLQNFSSIYSDDSFLAGILMISSMFSMSAQNGFVVDVESSLMLAKPQELAKIAVLEVLLNKSVEDVLGAYPNV